MTEPERTTPEERNGLVQLTVNLTPSTYEALLSSANITDDNRTDCVNRALLVYAYLADMASKGSGRVTFQLSDGGTPVRVDVNRPVWRFW